MKQILDGFAVAKIDVVNGYVPGKISNVGMLDSWIVKIIEVVQDDYIMPCRQQLLDKMRPDEARAACDQNSHAPEVQPRSTECTKKIIFGLAL